MKKSIKITLIALAAAIAFIAAFNLYLYLNERLTVYKFSGYYRELAKKCLSEKDGYNCCIDSVRSMEAGGYQAMTENGCHVGYHADMLQCLGSLQICVPDENLPTAVSGGDFNCQVGKEEFLESASVYDFFKDEGDYFTWCENCASRNGRPQISHDAGPFCNLKTGDGGQQCADSSQCQGYCLAEGLNDNSGICSEYEQLEDGCGWYELVSGEVFELCVS